MPKIVKPMDPIWIANYANAEPNLTDAEKAKIKAALDVYEKDSDKAADKCNNVLLTIVPI